MLHLKQTLLKNFTEIYYNTSTATRDLLLPSVARLNSPLVENLGRMLLGPILLANILIWTIVIFILNLFVLITQILTKLVELLKNIVLRVWNALCTSCRWVADQKNTLLTKSKWRIFAWKEDGDSHQECTSDYSEMPGELDKIAKYSRGIHTDEQFEKLRKDL